MCGRYTLTKIADLLRLIPWLQLPAEILERQQGRYNVAPSQAMPIATADGFRLAQWGFVPSWATAPPKVRPINARAESVGISSVFRGAFRRSRCIVPADGFYEWRKQAAETKQPIWIHRRDGGLFGFAGVWDRWRPAPDREPVETYAILTTSPNALMAGIHDRMPVILDAEDYRLWLDPTADLARVTPLMRPHPDGALEASPVGRVVNSPKNDLPDCIKPLVAGPM